MTVGRVDDHTAPNVQQGKVYGGTRKRAKKASKPGAKLGTVLQAVGVSLFVACPYLYHSYMTLTQDVPLYFVRWLLTPVVLVAASIQLNHIGRKLRGK